MRIMILNGPNLNMLGIREPHIYGSTTLDAIKASCEEFAAFTGAQLAFHQSNHEGELVDLIQSARTSADALIINPAAYSFTSIAIFDAMKIFEGPIYEVHISNIHARDELHRHSKLSAAVKAVIAGLGPYGYIVAMQAALQGAGQLPAVAAGGRARRTRSNRRSVTCREPAISPSGAISRRRTTPTGRTGSRANTPPSASASTAFWPAASFARWATAVNRYFILYELEDERVVGGPDYLARLNAPTPWSQRIMPKLGNFARGGGRIAASAGIGQGGIVAPLRLDAAPSWDAATVVAELARLDRIIAARVLLTDIAQTSIKTREKGMRANDGSFAALLLIEGLDEAAVRDALHHLRKTLPAEDHGAIDELPLYQLAFSLPKRLLPG